MEQEAFKTKINKRERERERREKRMNERVEKVPRFLALAAP